MKNTIEELKNIFAMVLILIYLKFIIYRDWSMWLFFKINIDTNETKQEALLNFILF